MLDFEKNILNALETCVVVGVSGMKIYDVYYNDPNALARPLHMFRDFCAKNDLIYDQDNDHDVYLIRKVKE